MIFFQDSSNKAVIDYVNVHAGSSVTGAALIGAGLFGAVFTLEHLQFLYFSVLIPPAAYHCYAWFKTRMMAPVCEWLKQIKDLK